MTNSKGWYRICKTSSLSMRGQRSCPRTSSKTICKYSQCETLRKHIVDRCDFTSHRFRNKFKSFIEQYEMREAQFQSILRMKELEVQYQQARYEGQRKAQEQEANKSKQLTSQVSTFSQTETELRSQLNIYVEKFKQVSSVCDKLVKALHTLEIRRGLAATTKGCDTMTQTLKTTSNNRQTSWDVKPSTPEPLASTGSPGSLLAPASTSKGGSLATSTTGITTRITKEEMRITFAAMFAIGPDGEPIGEPIWTSTSPAANPQKPCGPKTDMPPPTSLPKNCALQQVLLHKHLKLQQAYPNCHCKYHNQTCPPSTNESPSDFRITPQTSNSANLGRRYTQ